MITIKGRDINLMGWACALNWHMWVLRLDTTREYTWLIYRCDWCEQQKP